MTIINHHLSSAFSSVICFCLLFLFLSFTSCSPPDFTSTAGVQIYLNGLSPEELTFADTQRMEDAFFNELLHPPSIWKYEELQYLSFYQRHEDEIRDCLPTITVDLVPGMIQADYQGREVLTIGVERSKSIELQQQACGVYTAYLHEIFHSIQDCLYSRGQSHDPDHSEPVVWSTLIPRAVQRSKINIDKKQYQDVIGGYCTWIKPDWIERWIPQYRETGNRNQE